PVLYTLSLHDALPISIRDEGDAFRPQVVQQGLAFRAVGVDRDIERVPVVEAHPVVHRRLTERADGQGAPEAGREELLEPPRVRLDRKSTRLNSSHRTI